MPGRVGIGRSGYSNAWQQALKGNIAWHGEWSGPGWSNGKYQASTRSYNVPRDAQDVAAKAHDGVFADYEQGKANDDDIAKADADFVRSTMGFGKGVSSNLAGAAVYMASHFRNKRKGGDNSKWNGKRPRNHGGYNLRSSGLTSPSSSSSSEISVNSDGSFYSGSNMSFDSMEMPPGWTPQLTTQSDLPSMSNSGGDVPVQPIPRAISKIHPDHFNIRLPYIKRFTFNGEQVKFTNSNPLCLIRLNSIYDCIRSTLATVNYAQPHPLDNIHSAVGATSTPLTAPLLDNQGPHGRNIWQAHFKYYRVTRADVKLTFLNRFCDPGPGPDNRSVFKNAFAVGYELVDEDAMLSNNAEMFLCTKNAERDILGPPSRAYQDGATPIATRPNVHVMTYTYNPDTWQYHVEQKSTETRWTAVGANPALDHLMAVRMMSLGGTGDDLPNATVFGGGLMIQIEYQVQFMECMDSFYKTQLQQVASTTAITTTGLPPLQVDS